MGEGTARKRKRDDYPRCCAHNANLHPCDLSCEFEATKRAVWCRMVEESCEEATDRDIYSIRKLEGRSFLLTFLKRSREREREREKEREQVTLSMSKLFSRMGFCGMNKFVDSGGKEIGMFDAYWEGYKYVETYVWNIRYKFKH